MGALGGALVDVATSYFTGSIGMATLGGTIAGAVGGSVPKEVTSWIR